MDNIINNIMTLPPHHTATAFHHMGRPPTACKRCKHLKARCSGEVPECKRCLAAGVQCIYLHGVEMQLKTTTSGALKKKRRRKKKMEMMAVSPGGSSSSSGMTMMMVSSPPGGWEADRLSMFGMGDGGGGGVGVPRRLVPGLIEVYFRYHYNARLLLHKDMVMKEWENGTIKPSVFMAICAMGGYFYRDEKGERSLRPLSRLWANRADMMVFERMGEWNEQDLVASIILALFWYIRGEWKRGFTHKGMVMFTTHMLQTINNKTQHLSPIDGELSRRRYWACYLTNRHCTDAPVNISPEEQLKGLPLPWTEAEFEVGESNSVPVLFGSGVTNGGIYSEMIRAMDHWSSVAKFIKALDSATSDNDPFPTIHKLDTAIKTWWSKVAPHLRLTPTTIPTFSRTDLSKVLLINIAYHQSLCVLHASAVPLFTWGARRMDEGGEIAQQLSAQRAYDHACGTGELLGEVLDFIQNDDNDKKEEGEEIEIGDFPSFVGFAAYTSYAVLVPFEWCDNGVVWERTRRSREIDLRVLRELGKHWKMVELLSHYAPHIHSLHANHKPSLLCEPKNLPAETLNACKIKSQRARLSVLSLTGILWRENGCVSGVEELEDLEVEVTSEDEEYYEDEEDDVYEIDEGDKDSGGGGLSKTMMWQSGMVETVCGGENGDADTRMAMTFSPLDLSLFDTQPAAPPPAGIDLLDMTTNTISQQQQQIPCAPEEANGMTMDMSMSSSMPMLPVSVMVPNGLFYEF